MRRGRRFSNHLRAAIVSNAHSQTVTTCQPSSRRAFSFLKSRAQLPVIVAVHHSVRVLSIRKIEQCSCPCQKQPWTKIPVRCFGMTMSGLPAGSFRCRLKRYPMRCNIERTTFSGVVFLLWIRLMFQERCSAESLSAMSEEGLCAKFPVTVNRGWCRELVLAAQFHNRPDSSTVSHIHEPAPMA